MIKTYVLDLFCGAGGTSTAIHESGTSIEVFWCVNHDTNAIRSHKANYPNCIHSTEDIRNFDLTALIAKVKDLRANDPTCKIAVWASLECTNFSKAKCGPKDADSRTLAVDVLRYLDALKPDFFWVENVEEFRDWGPLDSSGNPDKNLKGLYYKAWVETLKKAHFNNVNFDRTLVSADYGGVTIRKRLFLQFSKDSNLIGIPVQTHAENDIKLEKWRAVKEVLDFDTIGKSIFSRKKPYVVKTHKRIYKGLCKFGPSAGTHFGIKYYGQIGHQDVQEPSCTLTTKDRVSLVTVFVHNPQYGGTNRSVEQPACTVIAWQDKAPLGLTCAVKDSVCNVPGDCSTDDKYFRLIKEYCRKHSITDILVRPLLVNEMLRIQGFPGKYRLEGTMTEQKKYIGNSVEVQVGKALFKSIDIKIQSYV